VIMAYRLVKTLVAAIAATGFALGAAQAAGGGKELKSVDWSHAGPFGTYDRAAVQRGFQVYNEVCAACHSLKYIAFRNLMEVGFSEDQAKAIAAEKTVIDGPNNDGEMFERPARLSDRYPSPFPNAKAAAAGFGIAPPDLSLMSKARPHGDDYIYTLLIGYDEKPDAEMESKLESGGNYNPWFPGEVIAMAAPLLGEDVEYVDGTKATVEQQARDVTVFLAWAAEPKMEERKQMGVKVILFLIFLSILLYLAKKRIWGRLH
jgi:ubiquinol-cytochrome c reductase cytochrome c1 subunit